MSIEYITSDLQIDLKGAWNEEKHGKVIDFYHSEAISNLFTTKIILYMPDPSKEADISKLNNKDISLQIKTKEHNEDKLQDRRFISGVVSSVRRIHYAPIAQGKRNHFSGQRLGAPTPSNLSMHAMAQGLNTGMSLLTQYGLNYLSNASFGPKSTFNKYSSSHFCYELTVQPKLHLLGLRKGPNRIFFKDEGINIIDDVIKVVLDEHSVQHEFLIEGQSDMKVKSCVQYNETDLQFVERLLTINNLCYFFNHEENKHTMLITNKENSFPKVAKKIKHGSEMAHHTTDCFHEINLVYNNVPTKFNTSVIAYETSYDFENKIETKDHDSQHERMDQELSLKSESNNYQAEKAEASKIEQDVKARARVEQAFAQVLIAQLGSAPDTYAGSIISLDGKAFEKYEDKEYLVYQTNIHINLEEKILSQDKPNNVAEYANNILNIASQTKPTSEVIHKKKDVITYMAIEQNMIAIKKNALCTPMLGIEPRYAPIGDHPAIVVDNKDGSADEKDPKLQKEYVYVKMLLWDQEHAVTKAFLYSAQTSFSIPRPGTPVSVRFVQNTKGEDMAFISNVMYPAPYFQSEDELTKTLYATYYNRKVEMDYNSIAYQDKKDKQEITVEARKDLKEYIRSRHVEMIGAEDKQEEAKVDHADRNSLYSESEAKDDDKKVFILKKGNHRLYIQEGDSEAKIKKGDRKYTLEEGNDFLTLNKGNITISVSDGSISIDSSKDITLTSKAKIILDAQGGIDLNSMNDVSINGKNITSTAKVKQSLEGVQIAVNGSAMTDIKGGIIGLNK
jgi:uncharacterized protein involved in type VI secretion and phage assembly